MVSMFSWGMSSSTSQYSTCRIRPDGTDRFVEKVAEIRSGQSALPQPCHRFMLESLYPQLLFRVPALGDAHPHGPAVPPGMGKALDM